MRTALFATALSGAAALLALPGAASAQNYYHPGAYAGDRYECRSNSGEGAIIGGLLGAVIGGVIADAVSDDDDHRYRDRRYRYDRYGYHRGYDRRYRRHHDRRYRKHDNDGEVAAGVILGGLAGAAIGASAGERDCHDYRYAHGRRVYHGPAYPGHIQYDPRYGDPRRQGYGYPQSRHYQSGGNSAYVQNGYAQDGYGYEQSAYAVQQSSSFAGMQNYADVLAERDAYYQPTPQARLVGGPDEY